MKELKREPFDVQRAWFNNEPVCTTSGMAVRIVGLHRDSEGGTYVEAYFGEPGAPLAFTRKWGADGREIDTCREPSEPSLGFDLRMGDATTVRCPRCGRWTPDWKFADDVVANGSPETMCAVCAMLATEALVGQPIKWEVRRVKETQ